MKNDGHIPYKRTGKTRSFLCGRLTPVITLIVFLLVIFLSPHATHGQAPAKSPAASPQRTASINDTNLQANMKQVDELLKKKDYVNSLRTALRIYDYTKEVLETATFIKGKYENAVNDPSVSQKDKEQLYLKLKGLGILIPRYTSAYESSLYSLGYIYAKRGETERARKHLTEYLQVTPFASGHDSMWMKAKTLLLELYGLEGEF